MRSFIFLTILFCFSTLSFAEEKKPSPSREEALKNASQGLHKVTPIELKALEIRGKIYEPQVMYVLDRSKMDIQFQEKNIQFSNRIELPILLNNLE